MLVYVVFPRVCFADCWWPWSRVKVARKVAKKDDEKETDQAENTEQQQQQNEASSSSSSNALHNARWNFATWYFMVFAYFGLLFWPLSFF